jgi:hypothetical protein
MLLLDINCDDLPRSAFLMLFGEQEMIIAEEAVPGDDKDELPLAPNFATAGAYSDRLAEQLGDDDNWQLPVKRNICRIQGMA